MKWRCRNYEMYFCTDFSARIERNLRDFLPLDAPKWIAWSNALRLDWSADRCVSSGRKSQVK